MEGSVGVGLFSVSLLCVCMLCACVLSGLQLLATLSMQPTRLLCPWDFPGKNSRVGILLHGIIPTQGLNPHLLHCGKILDRLSCFGNEPAFEPVPQVHLLEEPFFTNCAGYLEQLVNQKWGCCSHFHKSKPWMGAILASSLHLKTWLLDSNPRLCSGNSHPYTEERQTCVYLVVSVEES